ncbi:MAG TPA: M48 family metallopeptidase [Terriglobales bacterium]|nr:M48 family metallopeptidase [Terriglobales bacterium]
MKKDLCRVALSLVLAVSVGAFGQSKNEKPAEEKSEKPTVPLSTLNNIDAIGNRNVGCDRGIGNWVSLEKQTAMGAQYAHQVDQSSRLIKDPVVTEYVNRVGQNLVRNSDSKVPFTIKVIDDDSINAFALPGGFFYVNTGVVLSADNESEMAGVMAHEIAHVAACHAARQMTRGNLASIAALAPMILLGGWAGFGVGQAANIALPATFMKFSRGFEAEADYLGTEYLYKAGYDPNGLISFFEKVEALEKKKPGFLNRAFADHPQTPDRLERTQQEIATILPPKPEYVVDTSDFQQVKARLALIQNKHTPKDSDQHKPELRRTQQTGNKPEDDDRPTLHRAN